MRCEEMADKLVESWSDELSAADAETLAGHLAECAACGEDAEALGRLWRGIGELPEEEPSPILRERFEAMLAAAVASERATPVLRPSFGEATAVAGAIRRWPFAAALAATLVVGLIVGTGVSQRRSDRQMELLRGEVASLHETVTLALLAGRSPSERLRGVSYGRETSAVDERVAAALLEALLSDPNVNVRLAALEALRPLAGRPTERPRLVAALARQESPLVQLSLLEVLLSSGDDAARRDLDQLLSNPELDPAVRGYLRGRLGGNT